MTSNKVDGVREIIAGREGRGTVHLFDPNRIYRDELTPDWDANAIKLLKTLDPIMAADSGTGQDDCRTAHGDALTLTNISRQFADTCNHVHVDVDPMGSEPMKFSLKAATS